jgi:hypothetical protein
MLFIRNGQNTSETALTLFPLSYDISNLTQYLLAGVVAVIPMRTLLHILMMEFSIHSSHALWSYQVSDRLRSREVVPPMRVCTIPATACGSHGGGQRKTTSRQIR